MGPLTSRTWNVIQIVRPSRSFIGNDRSPWCFSLCPLADTRWGFLLGSMVIHSKSRGGTHAHPRNCPPIRAQYANLGIGGMVLCTALVPRCIQFRNSHLAEVPTGGVVVDPNGAVTSFTMSLPSPLPFLPLLLGTLPLLVSLNQQSLAI